MTTTTSTDEHPRHRLSQFVDYTATTISLQVGFGWRRGPDAPTTYDELTSAYERCRRTGEPLPIRVPDGPSVYPTEWTRASLIFWTLITHAREHREFSPVDRLDVAAIQLDTLARAGFGVDSREHRLFHADRVGPIWIELLLGTLSHNPRLFVSLAADLGMERALVLEAALRSRRISQHLNTAT